MAYKDLLKITKSLIEKARAQDFSGYDPFDLLNSSLLSSTPLYQSELVRLAWLQMGKRLPINLRPLLLVPQKRNPKGIGLFIFGLIQDFHRTGESKYLQDARLLADWLLTERCDVGLWGHSCWGYHFDWQARAFYVPVGKPNMITSCYIARALHELGQVSGEPRYTDISLDTAKFISTYLYTESDGRRFYAYIPGERAFVHNASLWGAAWCAFAGKQLNDTQMLEQAIAVALQSVLEQASDGSWVYGARYHHQFIDGFHTGYNLEALRLLLDVCGMVEFDESVQKGYHYYVHNFFEADGTAKYFNNKVYPIDMHSVAQAVFTLIKVGGKKEDIALCDKVIRRGIELLYMSDKSRFVYQKNRLMTNRINYTRWTQAWAYAALTFYTRYLAEQNNA